MAPNVRPSIVSRVRKAFGAGVSGFRAALRAQVGDGAEGLTVPRIPLRPFEAQGRSATPAYGGFVVGRETNPRLIGRQRYVTYDEMLLNTSIVAASVRYYLNMVSRPGWEFDPADVPNKDEARRYAELTDRAIRGSLRTPWHRFVKRAATYRLYGFDTEEWIAEKQKDGVICITDIQSRRQRTITQWDVDQKGVVGGIIQTSPHDGLTYYVPRGKLVYLVDDAFGDSPEGLGLFRQAVSANQYLSRFLQLEAWGYETDLKGMPIARVPLSYLAQQVADEKMTQEEADEIIAPYKEIIEKHVRTPELGMMLDSMVYYSKGDQEMPSNNKMFDLSVITGEVTANAQQAVSVAIERLNWDIARIFGTETLLLGANGRGAYALSNDKTKNLLMIVDGVLLDVAAQVKTDLILPIFQLNGWPLEYMPRPVTDAIIYRDISEITKVLSDMAKAGAVLDPDDPCIPIIRRAVGLPRPPEINRAAEAIINETEAKAKAAVIGASDRQNKPTSDAEPKSKPKDQQDSPGLGRE